MNSLFSQILSLTQEKNARGNMAILGRFLALLILMIVAYSQLFHHLMAVEGREYSWLTGLYWTLTVMSTLGFGDIAFTSDSGKIFSIVVLLSGVIFFLIMLPFVFIQYFYAPWLELQKKRRIPRSLAEGTSGHIILVGVNPLSMNLAEELAAYGRRGILLGNDSPAILNLVDHGYEAVVGEHDDAETYRNLRIGGAAMLVAMDSDVRNTNTVFNARGAAPGLPILSRVEQEASIDILELAGATRVFQFHSLLGEALARRVLHAGRRAGVLKHFENLIVVEAPLMRTSLVGATLRSSGLRNMTGVNVVGIWDRGRFHLPSPDSVFGPDTVIVAAGTSAQIEALEELLATDAPPLPQGATIILGGGRVGLAAALYLKNHDSECVIVDKNHHRARAGVTYVQGNAAELEVLEQAGLRSAPSVLITTRDDDTNIYLAIYCRRLRPDIQIISRATYERNVGILHAAGADLVLSLASLVTNTVINMLSPGKVAMLNEGLNLFRCMASETLIGKKLSDSGIRDATNCSVVAVRSKNDELRINPEPDYVFSTDDTFYLIGDSSGQARCYELYGHDDGESSI